MASLGTTHGAFAHLTQVALVHCHILLGFTNEGLLLGLGLLCSLLLYLLSVVVVGYFFNWSNELSEWIGCIVVVIC